MLRLFSKLVNMISRTETPVPLPLDAGKEKDQWVLLEPFPDDNTIYRGPLASSTTKPAIIGATWYPRKPADAASAGPILFHIHGGGFVVGDGRTDVSGPMFNLLLHHSKGTFKTIFAPQYRLSSRPTSAPFPAALQDALTAYLYLVRTLGARPADIVLSGDSAGGNIAIALLRYLVEYGPDLDLPQPRAAVLIAPWVNPAKSLYPTTSNPHFGTDYLGAELCRWGARTYIGEAKQVGNPYIQALGNAFRTPVPMLVTFGEAEILAVDGLDWVREMEGVEGNVLETFVERDAPHDTVLVGHTIGFEESAALVAGRIAEFVGRFV